MNNKSYNYSIPDLMTIDMKSLSAEELMLISEFLTNTLLGMDSNSDNFLTIQNLEYRVNEEFDRRMIRQRNS